MSRKTPKEKYIMVSKECFKKISRLQTKLQKIYGKNALKENCGFP